MKTVVYIVFFVVHALSLDLAYSQNLPSCSVKIIVKDNRTDAPVKDVTVLIMDTIANSKSVKTLDKNGEGILALECKGVYEITCKSECYFDSKPTIIIVDTSSVCIIKMKEMVDCYGTIQMPTIYFPNATSMDLSKESLTYLDSLLNIYLRYKSLIIGVYGHSDCRQREKYNFELSLKRAENVRSYLVSKGMNSNNIVVTGYGSLKPVNGCDCDKHKNWKCTEEEYQLNNRVVIDLLSVCP